MKLSNNEIMSQFGFEYKDDKITVSQNFRNTNGYHETYIIIYPKGDYNAKPIYEYCGSFVSGDRKEEIEVVKSRLKNIYPDIMFAESKSYFMSYAKFKSLYS